MLINTISRYLKEDKIFLLGQTRAERKSEHDTYVPQEIKLKMKAYVALLDD